MGLRSTDSFGTSPAPYVPANRGLRGLYRKGNMKNLSGIIAAMILAPLAILLLFATFAGVLAASPGPTWIRLALTAEALVMVGLATRYGFLLCRITEKK
jgi:hypothetical protein